MNDIVTRDLQRNPIVERIESKPDADPVQDYLDTLKSQSSVSTMEQALGVVVALLTQGDRPQSTLGQSRDDRKATAQQLRRAAHEYDWFSFDGKTAKAIIAAFDAETYAKASQGKMVAAVVGTLKQVTMINDQWHIDTLDWLDNTPMQIDDKIRLNQLVGMVAGRRALTTQSALNVFAKFKPKAQPRRKTAEQPAPAAPASQHARRASTIDRATPGASDHRRLTQREMKALWRQCLEMGDIGARNMAILALGFGCGLRRSEIANLQYEDIDWDGKRVGQNDDAEQSIQLSFDDVDDDADGMPYIPITIKHAKGDKTRIVNAANGARKALQHWREVRGTAAGPLLYSFRKGKNQGMQVGQPIDEQSVYDVVDQVATLAGVRKFSPHDMRRTFVSGFLAATGDLAMAARLAGHSNVQTTITYDRRDEDDKAVAVVKHVHVPEYDNL